MSEVLRPAMPEVTLDDALLKGIETFRNGCNFTLSFEGPRAFLEHGCYGVHVNLAQGSERLLLNWLQGADGKDKRRELLDVSPETIAQLKMRKPCASCGGFTFKVPHA